MLQKLRDTESDRLPVQVNAYLDNTIDVQSLLEDSDTKTAALDRVAELEEALSFVSFLHTVSPENVQVLTSCNLAETSCIFKIL